MRKMSIYLTLQMWYDGKIKFMDAIMQLFISRESFVLFKYWMFEMLAGRMAIEVVTDLIYAHIEEQSIIFWKN